MSYHVKKFSLAILFLIVVTLPLLAESTYALSAKRIQATRAYISPVLLSEEYWVYGAYVEDSSLLSFREPVGGFNVVNNNVETGRVLVVLAQNTPATVLKGKVRGLFAILPTHLYKLAYVLVSRDQLLELARTPGVLAVLPDVRLDAVINKQIRELGMSEEDIAWYEEILQVGGGGGEDYHYTVNITGALDVWLQYNIRGEETTIAIIDTGVDYGSPGLGLEAIARDEFDLPLVFDASSLGLVLTPVEANVTEDGYIVVDPTYLYVFVPPYYVFRWTNALYIGVRGCTTFSDFLPFPEDNKWYIGNVTAYGVVKFGLMFQYISATVGAASSSIAYTIPVILVDSDGDGKYDTLYADTTTALYLLRAALSGCGVTIPGTLGTSPDFSFADETPIRYGNEVIARDLNGDGLNDYSIGTLAGYVYDAAFAIILEKIGVWKELIPELEPLYGYSTMGPTELWSFEPVALVWPGLDPMGDYVVIEYDFNSHGTFCATTAAGRDYYAQTGYGVKSMSGQAPRAKIAASPALYLGTVHVSVYFFSGFDLDTPYADGSVYLWPTLLANPWIAFTGWTWSWSYLGIHQVDITSNSYGISGWAIWGWNTGMDPESAVFDYTTLVSGTAHFIAVGNGGPGYGTVTPPASSTLSIAVGAATEFTYRPFYGYYWPGSSRQVITWSNRGPTELGVVKPDVVAIGSFAWAVGRTWEALGARTLNGASTHALFSGTSQATPMAAGVGALVVSAYKSKYGSKMPSYLLKTILMNNAVDMGYDELSQGAGFVNAYKAVKAVLEANYPRVYSTSILSDILSELGYTSTSVTYGETLQGTWFEPKIHIPLVRAGRTATRPLIVEGRGTYRLYSARLEHTETVNLCDIVLGVIEPLRIPYCSGDTLVLNVTTTTVYGHLVLDVNALKKYDYFEIELVYPFQYFETGGRTGNYSNTISASIVELAYWIDVNNDGVFAWSETARIMYDIRGANSLRIQIGDLEGQIREIEELAAKYGRVSPAGLPRYLVMRIGVSGAAYRGLLPIKVRVSGYTLRPWSDVRLSATTLRVLTGSRVVSVIVRAPKTPGFYSGYVVVEELTRGVKMLVPISFFVPVEITREATYTIRPFMEATTRRNTYLRGVFDYTWRYESGDWRVFKVLISPTLRYVNAIGVRVTWPVAGDPTYASNLDVHVYGPYVYYMVDYDTGRVYQYPVNSVQLAAELSLDPTATTTYNPRRFWDSVGPGESLVMAPVLYSGVYRIVVRNIQYSGLTFDEPFTVEIIPVSIRVTTRYSFLERGYVLSITVRTTDSRLLPVGLFIGDEAVVTIAPGESYYVNLTEQGFTWEIRSLEVSAGELKATIVLKPPATAPRGVYTIVIGLNTATPVTTVGWIDAGVRNVYFEWYTTQVYTAVTIR
jgi:hypothetical protein